MQWLEGSPSNPVAPGFNSLPVADETQKVETSPAVRIVNLAVVTKIQVS